MFAAGTRKGGYPNGNARRSIRYLLTVLGGDSVLAAARSLSL